MDVFIGRQPIFNIDEEVVAYELLYRNQNINAFPNTEPDAATVDVLVNYFLSMGIKEVTKGKPGFVNFTENLLMSHVIEFINPSKIVIEILENVPITKELVDRVMELKEIGFKIALDDFVLNKDVVHYDKIFEHTDFIKVDFLATPLLERMEIENRVKQYYPHIQLLAEKVETRNQFDVAKHSGYTLFQGYFFEQPQIIKSTDIPLNTLQYFQVISLLKDEEPDVNLIAENIERDISLSYKLLQIINETNKRQKSKVRSIKQAILLLGLTELRKLIYLLAMREGELKNHTDLFKELMRTSLLRAKICEILAKQTNKENYSEYFLVGLFSLIDSLLNRPMDVILEKLPFSEEVSDTISGVETEMTPYLEFSIALSKMDWDSIERLIPQLGLDNEKVEIIYNEAAIWAEKSM
ncbi:EAL and modified HD-GYP domain-containing signal transduction protein [Ureibacillus xyleni]|uniref:EAL and modified HD-GYP domain-containing signal transduction protein n=1 Tax=Ureibacillus xyleni TaxID=614648 RepID=A0A285T6C3_9BACL|nr:HDOD domain-containing protein [Ureibacillus xyleni]SOC16970.1 EAL and modified HD-GYP domain-containing signal transduction protein [Ureibacillus xyleni]